MSRTKQEIFVKVKPRAVHKILAQKNLSLLQFAQKTKMSKAHATQIMLGKRYPSPLMRTRIQKILGAEWNEVFEIVELEASL